jgi:hypothetical protein
MGLCLTAASAGADTVDARCDTYPKGSDRASSVQACQFSQRQGYVSITRADGVRHEFSPQGSAGRYVDASGKPVLRQSGLGKRGQIYRLASESVYVYWDPAGLAGAAAMSAAASAPTALPSAPVATGPFDRRLSLQGIRFRVQATNQGSVGRVQITPRGLSVSNEVIDREVDGTVVGAEVADLNADGSPELYVYVRSAGSGSYGSLLALSANRRKSLSDIVLPELDAAAARGYQGHDQFAVLEGVLARRFPIYKTGDPNAAPSGGVRQIQYKLVAGEATWQLKVDKVVEF